VKTLWTSGGSWESRRSALAPAHPRVASAPHPVHTGAMSDPAATLVGPEWLHIRTAPTTARFEVTLPKKNRMRRRP
jgi:hypothetical protein